MIDSAIYCAQTVLLRYYSDSSCTTFQKQVPSLVDVAAIPANPRGHLFRIYAVFENSEKFGYNLRAATRIPCPRWPSFCQWQVRRRWQHPLEQIRAKGNRVLILVNF